MYSTIDPLFENRYTGGQHSTRVQSGKHQPALEKEHVRQSGENSQVNIPINNYISKLLFKIKNKLFQNNYVKLIIN